ncbi:NUDIX domain-containing protein [Hoyosella sp. G463]|uniref:NUDIX domain-containing protein n=1 Tax=Lolliginicoccus lacisalsi TaxID=2742202 RepID=A0A927JCQ8_9ACTN|nr:NUDIX domain-containing protein [Lolliginicoccus lacisalsi]MBD8506876.1 NUDIX domain-containing protein [Lolliginicoccus lacisalsi]
MAPAHRDERAIPIRDASTIILVRDMPGETDGDEAPGGIEVFLQRRSRTMPFAPGMTVFPGGGVDPTDHTAALAWHGPAPEYWASAFGTGEPTARALVVAAIRELYEECGVLLASHLDGSIVTTQWISATLEDARSALAARSVSFAELLREHDLTVRADLLAPMANWITPTGNSRRYDTRFFLAKLPPGQHADDQTPEADECFWRAPQDALAAWSRGEAILLPPTWSQLRALARIASSSDLPLPADPCGHALPIPPIESAPMDHPDGWRLGFPDCDAYYASVPPGLGRTLRP